MAWWTDRVLPRIINRACATDQLGRLRREVCAGLEGDVLEVGFGSGLNVPYYPGSVSSVSAVEPSDLAWRLAQARVAASTVPVRRAGLDGQHLDLPGAAYDSALSTFTLCTIPDLPIALAEIRRVLRPGGRLHFLEHGRAEDATVRKWQQRIEPVHGRVAGGCHLTRSIPEVIEQAGLEIGACERFYGEGPKVMSYLFLGWATRPLE